MLRLIAEGYANKEIGAQRAISEATIKRKVKSILSKLNANDRIHSAMTGWKRGIIEL